VTGLVSFVMPVIVPPRMLQAKDASTLWAALRLSEPIPVSRLASMAHVVVLVRECDAARPNDTQLNMEHARTSKDLPNAVQKRVHCFVHQLHMCTGHALLAIQSAKLELVSAFFSASHLLRTQGYFEAMLDKLAFVVDRYMVVRRGRPPAAAAMVHAFVLQAVGMDPDAPEVRELRSVCNGMWLNAQAIDVYVESDPCLAGLDRSALVRRVCDACCLYVPVHADGQS